MNNSEATSVCMNGLADINLTPEQKTMALTGCISDMQV